MSLFRLIGECGEATRPRLRLGRASVNTIEVIEGLEPGDERLWLLRAGQEGR